MAVIKDAAKRQDGDIAINTVGDGIMLYQDNALYCKPSLVSIVSRQECDDLIIALMLARDTLWPIQSTTE